MKRLLQLISLVFILIGTFLGLIYYKGDEFLIFAISISLFFTIIFFFIVDMLIKNKESIKKRKFSNLSIFLWFCFLIFSLTSSIFILHGMNVQINAKSDIQKQTLNKLNVLNNMTTQFQKVVTKDLNDFNNSLDTAIYNYTLSGDNNGKYHRILNSPPYNLKKSQIARLNTKNARQRNKIIESKLAARKQKFEKEKADVNFKIEKFLKDNTNTIKKWHVLELNTSFYLLNSMLSENKQQLTNAFNKHKFNEDSEFKCNIPTETIPLNNPMELWEIYKTNYLIAGVFLFYLFMLTPYLIHGDKKRKYVKSNSKWEGGIEL